MAVDTYLKIVNGVGTITITADNVETYSNAADAVSVNDAVALSASSTVARASASSFDTAIGLVLKVMNSTSCIIITHGVIEGFSTGMSVGDLYYLDEAGALSSSLPTGRRQIMGYAVSGTDLMVMPHLPETELHGNGIRLVDSASYTIQNFDRDILVDFAGAVTITLPAGATHKTRRIRIKDKSGEAGTNNITVNPDGSETIEDQSSAVINGDGNSLDLVFEGTNWSVF